MPQEQLWKPSKARKALVLVASALLACLSRSQGLCFSLAEQVLALVASLQALQVPVSELLVVAIERKRLSLAWSVLALLVVSPRHLLVFAPLVLASQLLQVLVPAASALGKRLSKAPQVLAAAAFEGWRILVLVSRRHFLEERQVLVPAVRFFSKVQQVLVPVVFAPADLLVLVLAAPAGLPLHPS